MGMSPEVPVWKQSGVDRVGARRNAMMSLFCYVYVGMQSEISLGIPDDQLEHSIQIIGGVEGDAEVAF